ncbi:pimeloyl-ACP methyl ester carboxylesterase [Micromonospora pisi]|uniref:Pimeloyl-ACP methyl ester carboxylesterase n=1 Tax=Micromonospora pisi TaxID=589240 RepID=A0A495JN73_9ACTN|nr:alpha/beta hydrolase [Micromonospora pisi]RKR90373.1 pimeloyl-ACP methyl ester carboxylesterase [Micromonospora pisi]
MSTKPTIILVHGAWHGAWCWSRLEPELVRRGIGVRALELTSHGTDPAVVGDLRSDVELVRNTVKEVDGPAVLLGHSYGGLVISEAADGLDQVTKLIFMGAFFPEVGDSMRSLTGGGRAPWLDITDGLMSVAPGWGRKLFYSDCDPAVAEDAERRLLPQSAASFGQEVQATAWRTIDSTYIVCTDDQAVSPAAQRRWASMVNETVVLRGGHSPMLSQPGRVAELIDERI